MNRSLSKESKMKKFKDEVYQKYWKKNKLE
jgi:hypothetical protein